MTASDIDLIRENFARMLRMQRNKLNLSQEELGHRAGITTRFVSLLECNKRQPTLSTLSSLSHALEMPLSEIFKEIEDDA